MDEKAMKTAKRFARQLSSEELKTLQEISVGLNPRKSNEHTKEEWFNQFKDNIVHYKLWNRTFRDELSVMYKMNGGNGLSKRDLQKAVAEAIAERQKEEGLSDYLMNTVRISLFNTLTRMFDNPKLRR